MADATIGSLTTSDFTIEGAFYISTATLNMYYLGKMDSTVEYAIRLDSVSSDILKFDLFQSDNTDRSLTIVSSLATAGVTANDAWHWISIRMDYSTGALLTCEIDGVSASSTSVAAWSGTWRQDVLSRFVISADGKDGTNIWDGGVDHVAIYLKSITDTQRSDNYDWWSASTVSGAIDGFGTPYSSSSASTGTKTYKFTTADAPTLTESGILRIVDAITESTAKLNPQAGLSSRASGSITMIDVKGDPNPTAPAVTEEIINTGTFLAKMNARNIMVNKPLRIKNYRVESDGTVDIVDGDETRSYLIESFDSLGNDKWSLKFKDELSRVNIAETVFPIPLEGSLRTAITNSATTIPVDANVTYLVNDVIRIGDELMKVSAVANIGTGTASLTVGTRGSDIVFTNTLSTTIAEAHEVDDQIYVCDVCDNEDIDLFLARVLISTGIDSSLIDTVVWAAEVFDWHASDKINTIWIESLDSSVVIKKVLSAFLMDLWYEPVEKQIRLTAVSQWRDPSDTITEGNEIDYDSVKRTKIDSLRYTRALVVYDKRNLTKDDSVENFNKGALYRRTDLESVDFYGEAKTKRFDHSSLLNKASAELLVNRYVTRNENPLVYKWITQERKLNFKVGDILNLVTTADVGFGGSTDTGTRAQITKVQPKYSRLGREYSVEALSYLAEAGDKYIISGNVRNINIHNYVGAPNAAVTVTIIFDAATIGSTDTATPSIIAGAFASGSKLIFILANASDLQGKGGDGGNGMNILELSGGTFIGTGGITKGGDGGTVYDAQGIDTDIYFSGATPDTDYPTADGYIRAPSGGDGGFLVDLILETEGAGGDGGTGIDVGIGGLDGKVDGVRLGSGGNDGVSTADWGIDGVTNDQLGGAKGSGVVDTLATVTFFGSSASRYINGAGDH